MNTGSLLYRPCAPDELRHLVGRHFGPTALARASLLEGGLFNTTYLLTLADGRRYVLRLGPVNRQLLLPFEHGMMAAEAHVYALCAQAGVPVPRVVATGAAERAADRDYMITEYIPSTTLFAYEGEKRAAYRALGEAAARLHGIRGARFGRVSQLLRGGGYATWSAAMLGEFRDWRRVAEPAGCYDRAELERLEAVFRGCAPVLDAIATPRLAHADLWSGNVLVTTDGGLAAVIDADRCLFGDPAFDFAEGWLDDPAFYEGYGRPSEPDAGAALRERLYQLLYGLLDGYVYSEEYRDPEAAQRCREKALGLLRELEAALG